jgi:hypothetical protein
MLPGARLETAQELLEAIPEIRPHALRLLSGHPDIEALASLETAPQEIVDQMISMMVESGEYMAPEPFMDLEFAKRQTQNTYLRMKMRGVPDDRLELLRQFMVDCQDMLTPPQEQAAPTVTAPQAQLPLSPDMAGAGAVTPPVAQLPLLQG